MIGYPSSALLGEVAFVAYHLHWPYSEIMAMDHRERRWWVAEVAHLNARLRETGEHGR